MSLRIFSLRWKIIALFGVSILLSLFCVAGLIRLAHDLGTQNRFSFFYNALKRLQTGIGIIPLGVLIGFAFFLLFFFLLSRGAILYLEKISRTLQQVSLGRLDIQIPPRSPDELGELAENINRMTSRLQTSLDEERDAERIKDELISSVSHDLRTPLTSVLGYLELIEKNPAAEADVLRRYAAIAYQKSRQLKKLIDDLFEYTNVSQAGLKFEPTRIDLKELLAQLAEEFGPTCQIHDRTIRLTASGPSYFVRADGDLMVRVFENLLSNAVRYGRRGGIVKIDLSRDGDWTIAAVSNTGDPISPKDLPRIFDRFYRADPSRSDTNGGIGLGLAIAKSIVDHHAGLISVRSDAEGTVFEVRLKSAP